MLSVQAWLSINIMHQRHGPARERNAQEDKKTENHGSSDDVQIDIYSPKKLVSGVFKMPSKMCIYKIPTILRRHNKEAFEPTAFSIGPWHFTNPNLRRSHRIKWKYLQGLLRRISDSDDQGKQLELLARIENEVQKIAGEAIECYAESIRFNENDFVKILVLDGCFIVELLRKDANLVPRDEDDPIFSMSSLLQNLTHDLILLENQIPWLVLDLLFNLTKPDRDQNKPLDQLVIEFFSNMFTSPNEKLWESLQRTDFARHQSKHILDLLRNSLVLSIKEETHKLGWHPLLSATALKDAGIEFKKVSSNSILDIHFTNGIFQIPSLMIQETTEPILRNLISFEQCYPNCPPRVTSYVKLLVSLIKTSQDMSILYKEEIMDGWLTAEQATPFFHNLDHDAYVKDFYYVEDCERVDQFCKRRWPRWRTNLRQTHCHSPWAIIGLVFGFCIGLLTLLQTIYTMKGGGSSDPPKPMP